MARRKVLITGAAGGMGRACARLFGMTDELILADVSAERLNAFADELEADAYTVSARIVGETCDESVIAAMVAALGGGAPFVVVHAAGLSPSMADWEAIMRVNLQGTARLMAALEPLVVPGTVAVLIASTAGHGLPAVPGFAEVLADPLNEDLVERCRPFVDGVVKMSGRAGMEPGMAYSFSKLGVLRHAERKAMDWGPKGGRVVTISPGLMLTPMGRKELAETDGARQVLDAAPVGRPGTAQDIAVVARFLASEEASFISGSDVRVDGG
ncbi:MAG TPA: SDR family oxidoreductase, partial [Novosphingobium sp.]|nr:SDR family oxidoreductase [Novosphingobium sp.]